MTRPLKRLCRSVVFALLITGCGHDAYAQQNVKNVKKEVCLTSFGMDWKTAEEAQTHLLMAAKREAVGEIFGEMIRSVTQVQDFQLQRDEIESLSSGFVRVQGSPEFRQGTGFGEMCTKIDAYVAEEDIQRFRPRPVQKKVCIADPRLSLGEVRETAEQQARIQAVRDFEPKLQSVQDSVVLTLIHESKTESAGFLPETTTYCVKASGIVYPIELLSLSSKSATINTSLKQEDKRTETIPTRSQIFSFESVSFELQKCHATSANVACHMKITNQGEERYISASRGQKSRLTITGEQYPSTAVRIGSREGRSASDKLAPNTPTNATMYFKPVPSSVHSVELLEFQVRVGRKSADMQFRDIPLIRQ